jgi:hypothetical protein
VLFISGFSTGFLSAFAAAAADIDLTAEGVAEADLEAEDAKIRNILKEMLALKTNWDDNA